MHNKDVLFYLPYFFIPLLLSLLFTPLVRRIAVKNGFISFPRPDRWHKRPTAIFGGVAIFASAFLSSWLLGILNRDTLGIALGALILFTLGLLDDKFHFPPHIKLFAQIVAGALTIFFMPFSGININFLVFVPFALLWIIGITNSFNLLDNIDGLAAGIAVISSFMLFLSSLFFYTGDSFSLSALIICGAALGFLPYNFNPAKIFMGDSGSMFLGYSLAVISISGTGRHVSNLLTTLLIPVLILTVPIFDTLFVMLIRKIQGKNIFEGGKDHTSHHLVTLGLSQRKTVLLLYAVSIAFGLIAISYSRLNIFFISIIAFLSIVVLLFFGLFLFEVNSDRTKKAKRLISLESNNVIINNIIFHKRRIIEVVLDLVLICIAYTSAYFLRFEGGMLANNLLLLQESLIWIIVLKMSVFFIFGLYRGVWRYVSISDLITICKVVTLGSVISILFLTFVFRFQQYSRTVLFLDWILLLFLIAGSRIFFRVLGEFFSRARQKGRGVLIFGAGDTGEMVIREIKRNKELNYNPVGFIDDDPTKIGNRIQGVRILGSREIIKNLCRDGAIEEIIIAIPSIIPEDYLAIVKICKECGINYRKIKGILDKEEIVGFGTK